MRERVILHLLAYQRYQQDPDAPATVTQEGIAEAVDVGRNNVSKIVNSMEGRRGRGPHQTCQGVRQCKGLLPNSQCYQNALNLKLEIERTKINIIDFDGKVRGRAGQAVPVSAEEICLPRPRDQCRGSLTALLSTRGKLQERRFVDYTDRKPTVRSFYGRQKEMAELIDFLNSDTASIMSPGIPDQEDHSPREVRPGHKGTEARILVSGP